MAFPQFGSGASRNGKKQIAAYVDEATWSRVDGLSERLHLSREDLTCLAVNLASERRGDPLPMRTTKQRFIRRKKTNLAKRRKAKTSAGTRRDRLSIASFHPVGQVEQVHALAAERGQSTVDYLAACFAGLDEALSEAAVQKLLYPGDKPRPNVEEVEDAAPVAGPATHTASGQPEAQGSLF